MLIRLLMVGFMCSPLPALAQGSGVPVGDLKKFNTQGFGGESSPDVSKMKDKTGLDSAPLKNRTGMPTAGPFRDTIAPRAGSTTVSPTR
jgi:hypothetical protein